MTTRKWFGPAPDNKTRKEELENLYVFGYHCKLFRDDEKAEYVEKEEHLIPWMGDGSLMIDRSVTADDNLKLFEKVSIWTISWFA